MNLFNYTDYKHYIVDYIDTLPNAGRGEYRRIADYLKVSSVMVSQVFKGSKDLSGEQAIKLTQYLNLLPLEQRYFITLVSFNRAGNQELKDFYYRELTDLQEKSKLIINKVKNKKQLNKIDQAEFYSDWKYSALRLACDLESCNSIEDLVTLFKISEKKAEDILSFLIRTNLVVKKDKGLELGTVSTHLEKDSPFINNTHRNWRLKSMETIDKQSSDDLIYTAPFVCSKDDFLKAREELLEYIKSLVERVSASKGEDLFYLNLDLRRMNID